MKRILFLLILVPNLTFGQTSENYQENINKDFVEYNDLILKQEFEKSMDYLLPEFFEIIPKNHLGEDLIFSTNETFINQHLFQLKTA